MAQLFTPVLDAYVQMATQGLFQPAGTDYFERIGDIEAAPLTPTLTDIERFSREYPEKTLAATKTIQKDASFTLTLLSIHRTVASWMFMDTDGDKLIQAAATAQIKTFNDVKAGRVYNLGKSNVTITTIVDGATTPAPYVLDVNYRVVAETGDIEVLSTPGASAVLKVTFAAAAISEVDDIATYGLLAGQGAFGKFKFFGINDQGVRYHVVFHNCRVTVNGTIPLQGGDDYMQVEVNVKVYADGSQPSKYRFAKITELKG